MNKSIRKILEKNFKGTDEQMETASHELMILFNKVCPKCNSYHTQQYGDSPMICECGNIYFDSVDYN